MSRDLLDRAVERWTLDGHDGRSGARIERVRLDDGTSLVVKTATPGTDLTVGLTGGVPRERLLWESGALDRLRGPVAHPILDIWDEDGAIVTLMRDLGDAVPGWSRVLTAAACARVVEAMAAVHDTFADAVPQDLCPLPVRLTLLSQRTLAPIAGQHPLADAVLHGWERFAELTPPDLATAVFAIHDDPSALAAAMQQGATSLLHADLWLVNLALEPAQVVLLDWALATEGPPALDLAVFLTGSAAHIALTPDELIAAFRAHSPHTDDRAMDLALLAGLVDMGWNKALDALEHEDPAVRARQLAELQWWQARAIEALERTALSC